MNVTVEQLAANAGISLRQVAREWPVYKPRLGEKQIRNRIDGIRRALRRGGIGIMQAQRLGKLLNCDPALFLSGKSLLQKGTSKVPQVAGAKRLRHCNPQF